MRKLLLATAALLVSATTAFAAPAQVSVSVGPELQAKAQSKYGVTEIHRLADELRDRVSRRLAKTGAYADSRVELTLVKAVPSRPTFKELGDRPGLSMESFSLGGATVAGRIISADGAVTPVNFQRYETDIRFAPYSSTWQDADRAFELLAGRLSHGEQVASR